MTTDLENPFKAEDLEQIKVDLDRIDAALRAADKAKLAGFDVDRHVQQLQDTRSKLQAVRQTYFPNQ